jgi:hypothetical protein
MEETMTRSSEGGDVFGYEYFDAPTGLGYRGYQVGGNADGYLPWQSAARWCVAHHVETAVDVGCAKGFLVAALRSAGVRAIGLDVSEYALSFAHGQPCLAWDIRHGIPVRADAVFVLGVLCYLTEHELSDVLADLRACAQRFLLVSNYYEGDPQEVRDPLRVITRPQHWWNRRFADHGFAFDVHEEAFDVYVRA